MAERTWLGGGVVHPFAREVRELSARPMRQGLVGAWYMPFARTMYDVLDMSGRHRNGRITNLAASDWINSPWGPALDFDETNDDYIDLSTTAGNWGVPTGEITIVAGARRTRIAGPWVGDSRLIAKSKGSGDAETDFMMGSDNHADLRSRFLVGGTTYTDATTNGLSLNEWHVYAVGYDRSTTWHFIDDATGRRNKTSVSGALENNSDMPVWIGRNPGNNYGSWVGEIAFVLVYNRTLAIPELRSLSYDPFLPIRVIPTITFNALPGRHAAQRKGRFSSDFSIANVQSSLHKVLS